MDDPIYEILSIKKFMTIKIYMIRERTVIIFFPLSLMNYRFSSKKQRNTPFLELSINATPFFCHLARFITFYNSHLFLVNSMKSDARASKRNGESPSQATGGFRSMHPYVRLPARVRCPASSSDVILPYLAIPGYPPRTPPTPMQQRESARSNFRPSKTGSEPLLMSMELFLNSYLF